MVGAITNEASSSAAGIATQQRTLDSSSPAGQVESQSDEIEKALPPRLSTTESTSWLVSCFSHTSLGWVEDWQWLTVVRLNSIHHTAHSKHSKGFRGHRITDPMGIF